jgi:hypothetical protein
MMADEAAKPETTKPATAAATKPAAQAPVTGEEEHYEVVSEYRIGEGAPPLFLVICFVFIVVWAMFSWIPFFGY